MNNRFSIQLKAVFLLITFSLNTVIGFACTIGFNKPHHPEEKATVHVHADGKKHYHKKKTHKNADKKDDCCNDKVVKIAQADKAIPDGIKLLNPVFFTAYLAAYLAINISFPSQVNTFHKYFVRGHHPPISDIRIAIQSFQI